MPAVKRSLKNLARRFGYEIIEVQALLPREIRSDYDVVLDKMGEYRFKFLDLKTFLPTTLKRAHRLGLHQPPALKVLDIGTGTGYFPFVCEHYGHRAVGLDRDGNEVFEDACRWLGIDRRSVEIHHHQPLPDLGTRFDLVTAFMVNFDRFFERDLEPWGVEEWDYFLRDIADNHLEPDGRLFLQLNGHTMAEPEVLELFAERGAERDNTLVLFSDLSRVRS